MSNPNGAVKDIVLKMYATQTLSDYGPMV